MNEDEKQRSQAELTYVLEHVFSVQGLTAAAGIAVPFFLAGLIPILTVPLVLLYAATLAAYYFLIVKHMGAWAPGLPNPANRNSDLLSAFARGLALLLAVLLPMLLYALFTWTPPHKVLSDPWARTLTLLASSFYLPAAIVAGSVGSEAGAVLWMPNWARVIRADPRGYARLTLRFLIIACTWAFTVLVAALLFGAVPLLGTFIVALASDLILFVQAGVVGIYAGNNAHALGLLESD